MDATRKRLRVEIAILFFAVLGSIRLFYGLRHIPLLHDYLSTLVAILLVYPALLHTEKRKLPFVFWDKNWVSSLKVLLLTSLVVFPLFLCGNAIYQTQLLHRVFVPNASVFTISAILAQIVLVGFPEEFFFRGYLQPGLRFFFPRLTEEISFLRPLRIHASWSIPLSALLFAASHSFIAYQWWHFSIFFPALVFGWLREKTNGLIAPTLFHALSNIVITWIGASYR